MNFLNSVGDFKKFSPFFTSIFNFATLLLRKLSASIVLGKEEKNMTFTYRYRKQILIGICLFLVLSVLGLSLLFQKNDTKKTSEDIVLNTEEEEIEVKKPEEEEQITYYQVDIKGEINNPGIYEVKEGSRVIDVIRLAGDLTSNADTSVLNLSKKVKDEMVIIVYSYDEVANFTETKEKEKIEQEACIKQSELINGACIDDSSLTNQEENSEPSTKISLNNATLEELMTLNGIGESKAKAIITYRDTVGAFKSIEELKNVDGIGDTLFDQIKENITT